LTRSQADTVVGLAAKKEQNEQKKKKGISLAQLKKVSVLQQKVSIL